MNREANNELKSPEKLKAEAAQEVITRIPIFWNCIHQKVISLY